MRDLPDITIDGHLSKTSSIPDLRNIFNFHKRNFINKPEWCDKFKNRAQEVLDNSKDFLTLDMYQKLIEDFEDDFSIENVNINQNYLSVKSVKPTIGDFMKVDFKGEIVTESWFEETNDRVELSIDFDKVKNFDNLFFEVERELYKAVLLHCEGNRTKSCKMIGMSIRTLRNKANLYRKLFKISSKLIQ